MSRKWKLEYFKHILICHKAGPFDTNIFPNFSFSKTNSKQKVGNRKQADGREA